MLLCCGPLRYIIAWKLVPTPLLWSIGFEGNKWVFVRIGELKLVCLRHYAPGYKLVLPKGVLIFHLISLMPRILDFDGNSVFSFFLFLSFDVVPFCFSLLGVCIQLTNPMKLTQFNPTPWRCWVGLKFYFESG